MLAGPWALGPDGPGFTTRIVGELLIRYGSSGSRSTVEAYRLSDLELVWRRAGPSIMHLVTCGDLLCASGEEGVRAIDPATGRVLGSLPLVGPPGCVRHGAHLACQVAGGGITVWRIDP